MKIARVMAARGEFIDSCSPVAAAWKRGLIVFNVLAIHCTLVVSPPPALLHAGRQIFLMGPDHILCRWSISQLWGS